MSRIESGVLAMAGGLVLAMATAGLAAGDERPKASSPVVQVPAQGGGGGVQAVPGSPPPVLPPSGPKPARAARDLTPPAPLADRSKAPLRALSVAQGEATLEIDGRREVVRPGSLLGRDIVKAVAPGRLVLDRPAEPGQTGPALVIVTFDEAGRGKTRVFWTTDPSVPKAREAKRP